MLRLTVTARGPHRVRYDPVHALPRPCASRWNLRLAKARLWDEYIDPDEKAAWQLEDVRHMSPEFKEFIGYPRHRFMSGYDDPNHPKHEFEKILPNETSFELRMRRDVPMQSNLLFGKQLYDRTMYGTDVPYAYRMWKDMQKASRNDRKLKQNKFRIIQGHGVKNPPSGFEPIPDAGDEEEE